MRSSTYFAACRRIQFGAALTVMTLLVGCGSGRTPPTQPSATFATPDLDSEIAQASIKKLPVLVFVVESGKSDADNAAVSVIENLKASAQSKSVVFLSFDLYASRNRATVARFHVIDTPLLLCLSSKGVQSSRDEKSLSSDLVLKRIEEITQHGPDLDAKLAALETALSGKAGDVQSELKLADFFRSHDNAREAIPHFAAVAHSETAETGLRIRAWVDLARAHLWIAEPEKGRHEASDLIATLGPKAPAAIAGGKLVFGIQDANAKRTALARSEFEEAIRAAPDSIYAGEATQALAKLPKEGK